jgi:hypothetical protein
MPTPTPAPLQHLYQAGQGGASDLVAQYSFPLNSGSVPNFAFTTEPNLVTVAVDAGGTLAVGNTAGQIKVYPGPFSPSSTVAATFANGSDPTIGQIAFGPARTMFVRGMYSVNVFVPPFSNASTPSSTLANVGLPGGAAVDSSGNLYVSSNIAGVPFHANILVFMFPYTSPPIVTPLLINTNYRQMALSGSLLFVAAEFPTPAHVHVYTLPITATSTPSPNLVPGMSSFFQVQNSVALDATGNLYVQNTNPSDITSWTPPSYTGPVSTLNTTGGNSIAIGP